MIPIIYIFIVFVAAYATFRFGRMSKIDLVMIWLSIFALIVTMIYMRPSKLETYVDPKPIVLEENVTPIKNGLVVYLTAFNKNSFDESGSAWLNIASANTDGTCDQKASNAIFTYELQPVFTRKSGFYLGNNRLVGPYSNALRIQFHNTFTMCFACKHGNLLVDDSNNEIELFKFYANSQNNNGLCMYIQKNSLENVNNVQMGNLMFQYGSNAPLQCKVNQNYSKISFERDVLTFYFIVKDTDHVRVLKMDEKTTNIVEILRFNVQNTDVTFSNKEFVINRLKNWNGNVYTVAMYEVALPDEDVANLHSHVLSEYMKYVNPNFIELIQQYNDMISQLSNFVNCPYDKEVCDKCSTIDKWYDNAQIMNAPMECKTAIDAFCSSNPTHALCKCWNPEQSSYKTEACKMFRSIFAGSNSYLDGLTQEEIDYIMKKYGLLKPEDCPKPIVAPKLAKTNYAKYELDKLKVKVEDGDASVSKKRPQIDEEYDWNKLKIKYEGETSGDASVASKQDLQGGLKVSNYYKEDASTNYKLENSDAAKEYERMKALAKKEIETKSDASTLNIAPTGTPDLSQKAGDKPPPPEDVIVPVHKPILESGPGFFDKFSKMLFPA